MVKNLPANAGNIRDTGSIPGLGRSSGEGNGNPPQYSCLEDPVDRGAWWATVHRIAKSWTQLRQLSTHTPIPTLTHAFIPTLTHTYQYVSPLPQPAMALTPQSFSSPCKTPVTQKTDLLYCPTVPWGYVFCFVFQSSSSLSSRLDNSNCSIFKVT